MSLNRLSTATSAYLKSAAHQPIHWFPWGEEAFAAARAGNKPVLLDIGAVWCHWCHVMDGESYENPELAGYLNQHFVCIKVDRDERPDVDARYQHAVQAFSRQGGWPLTAFLTPAGEVFYGGTYFPPDGKYGRPGFRTVLASVLEAYQSRRDQVEAQAQAVRRLLDEHLDEGAPGEPSPAMLQEAVSGMARVFDPVHGGFGSQPKFPHPAALALLLHRWCDEPSTEVRSMIDRTLQGMGRGGMYDQIGGGFHRYSVDAEWIVPHFEKMSYDNSELLKAYLDAYAVFGTEEYAEIARGIVGWVRDVASDPEGGYAASQDADVGLDDDGDYFTWTLDEAAAVLSAGELEVAAAYYDIGTAGEMHHNPGKNVLFVAAPLAAVAARLGRSEDAAAGQLASVREKLRAARARRPTPFVDRTRYTSWNAMMASAMLRAGMVLDDGWAQAHALSTMERVWRDYRDVEVGGLFDIARGRAGQEGLLPAPAKPIQDTPTPSSNGTAGIVCARLHQLTGSPGWGERGAELVRAFAGHAADLGLHAATYLLAVDWQLSPVTHLVVVGERGDPVADRMHRAALSGFLPRRVVRRLAPGGAGTESLPPPLAAMIAAGRAPRGYACTGASCSAPAEDLETWQQTLGVRFAEALPSMKQ
jgi:uncharacterized protein YyaL (SSP411 family)